LTFRKGSVTTHLGCGEIFSDSIITNFVLTLTVKKFENWSKCANFWVTLYINYKAYKREKGNYTFGRLVRHCLKTRQKACKNVGIYSMQSLLPAGAET